MNEGIWKKIILFFCDQSENEEVPFLEIDRSNDEKDERTT